MSYTFCFVKKCLIKRQSYFSYIENIYNTKKVCFIRLRGCPYAPIHLDAPVCLNTPICLDVPRTFGCQHTIWQHPNIQWGSQTYGGYPNIQGVSKHVGVSNHTEGCPNMGASKHMEVSKNMGASKHTGAIQTYGGI